MRESNIIASNVTINLLIREILLRTIEQYMRGLNILAVNVSIKQLQREVWLDTIGQYIKEANFLIGAGRSAPCSFEVPRQMSMVGNVNLSVRILGWK